MTKEIPIQQLLEEERKGRLRKLLALFRKESYQIIRDPSSILITFVLPIFLLFLYGFGVSLDLDHLRLGIVMEDSAPEAQSLVQSFTDSRYFDTKIVRDRRDVFEDIVRGKLRGFVVIPSYFSVFRDDNRIAPIQVIADGSEPNTASFVQNYVQGAFVNWVAQQHIDGNKRIAPSVILEPRFWYNEQLESRYFLLSGSLAIIMTLIGTLLTALVVAREWERGTMEAMMSTTIGIEELIIGKIIPYFILGVISMVICIGVSVLGYGLPLRGSFWLLMLVSMVFLLCALGLGLLISTVARNQIVAYQISVVTGFLPAYILSGFLFEISSMPYWIQILTYLLPARYFVQCLTTLFLVGNVWGLIISNIIPMIFMALILFLITAKKTVKRLD